MAALIRIRHVVATWLPAIVLVSGFGAVCTIYLVGDWPQTPGLFHYRSATFGDGLLLPLIAAASVKLARGGVSHRRDVVIGWTGLALGLAGGALVINAWAHDTTGSTNWTMPVSGHFNAAGWYHALFLSAASGALNSAAFVALARTHRKVRNGRSAVLRSPVWITFLNAVLLFTGLVVDDGDPRSSSAALASVGVLGVAVVVVLLIFFGGLKVKPEVALAPLALVAIYALVGTGLAHYRGPWNGVKWILLFAALGAAVSCVATLSMADSLQLTPQWNMLLGFGYVVIYVWIAMVDETTGWSYLRAVAVRLVIGTLLIAAVTYLALQLNSDPVDSWREFGQRLKGFIPGWLMFSLALVAAWYMYRPTTMSADGADVYSVAVALPVLTCVSPLLRHAYDAFVKSEEDKTRGRPTGRAPDAQRLLGRITAGFGIGIGLLAVATLVLHTVVISQAKAFDWEGAAVTLRVRDGVVVALLAALLVAAAILARVRGQSNAIPQVLVLLAALGWAGFLTTRMSFGRAEIDAAVLSVIVGLWCGESLYMNGVIFTREVPNRRDLILCVGVGVMSAAATYATATVCQTENDADLAWDKSLYLLGLVLLITTVIVAIAGLATIAPQPSNPDGGTNYGPIGGILQDQLLISLLVAVLVFMPLFGWRHAPHTGWARLFVLLPVLLGFITFFGSVFCWILRYNTRHGMFKEADLAHLPWDRKQTFHLIRWPVVRDMQHDRAIWRGQAITDQDQVRAIVRHTTFQNVIGISCVAAAVAPLAVLWAENPIPEP